MDNDTSLNETVLFSTGCKLIAVYFLVKFLGWFPTSVAVFMNSSRELSVYSPIIYGFIFVWQILLPALLLFYADPLAEWLTRGERELKFGQKNEIKDLIYLVLLFLGISFFVLGVCGYIEASFRWSLYSKRLFEQNFYHLLGPGLRLLFGGGLIIFAEPLSGFLLRIKRMKFNLSEIKFVLSNEEYIPFIVLTVAFLVFVILYFFG